MNTEQTITGLAQAYGMGADLAAGLAVVAILLEGDPIAGTWSIGGPYPSKIVDALGEQPQGISYSHNNYEGDSSVTRVDAYLNGGDAHSLSVEKFEGMICYVAVKCYTATRSQTDRPHQLYTTLPPHSPSTHSEQASRKAKNIPSPKIPFISAPSSVAC